MEKIRGIHHVTAIAGPPQGNVDFYVGLLGLRLVKKTVNFDDPGTYHLYYGDGEGNPGSILTFFPWENAVPGRVGAGMVTDTAFSVAIDALDYWMERFADTAVDCDRPQERFGQTVLPFRDPDGLRLELVAHSETGNRRGWVDGPVPAGQAIRSFHGVTLGVAAPDRSARLLTDVFGYQATGEENGRSRFASGSGEAAAVLDLVINTERGRSGAGAIHHVAFRARDEEEQLEWQDRIRSFGLDVTEVRDRTYFKSIYFHEPGGVLFEIATDPPGFTYDETVERLGTDLKLPPWVESRRPILEQRLRPLVVPGRTV